MHTQKKGLSRVEQAGKGRKRTGEEERSWSNKDGGRRGRCRLPTDLRDHSLLLFSFLSLRSIPILVFSLAIYLFSRFFPLPPRDLSPCQSLLFLGLLFIGMQEYLFPLSLSTSFATRLQPEPTDFLFHCFCPCSHAPIYRNNYCSGRLFILRQCNSCRILIVCELRVNLPHARHLYVMYV